MSALNRVSSSMVQHGTKHLDTILASLNRQPFDVMAFGALGNNANDDTAAIQAAINAAAAAGGGAVFLPAGVYRTTAALTITASNIVLRGEGMASVLKAAATAINIVEIGDGTANPNNSVVENLRFTATSAMDAGTHAIVLRNGRNLMVSNVHLDGYGTLYNGIRLLGGEQQTMYTVQNFMIDGVQNHGIVVDAHAGHPPQHLFLRNGTVSGGTDGIVLLSASEVSVSLVECLGCTRYGLSTAPASEASVRSVRLNQCLFNGCAENGVFLASDGGTVHDVQANGCRFASNGQNGISIATDTTVLSGCLVTDNGQNGVATTNSCRNLVINGSQISANNTSNGAYHGVYLAPGTQNFVVQGNQIGIGSHTGVNRQKYGVFVDTTMNSHYLVRNNLAVGNVQGGVYDGGLTTQKSVGDNIA